MSIDPNLLNLFHTKQQAEIAYHKHKASFTMGMATEDEIQFDIEACRLFLASVEADVNYDNAIKKAAYDK